MTSVTEASALRILAAYSNGLWQQRLCASLARDASKQVIYLDMRVSSPFPKVSFEVVVLQTRKDCQSTQKDFSRLKDVYPEAKFVVVLERLGVTDIAGAHFLGISAFLDEKATGRQIALALEAAARGDVYVSSLVARRSQLYRNDLSNGASVAAGGSRVALSPRETEVLTLVARGLSNKAIGNTLFISQKTVKNHLYSIFRKLGVKDRTNAALIASKHVFPVENGPFDPAEVFCELDDQS